MSVSRDWMYNRTEGGYIRLEFVAGVKEFIKFAMQHCTTYLNKAKIRCPCRKCRNEKYYDVDTIELHLVRGGFIPDYYCWTAHGEEEIVSDDDDGGDDPMDEYPTSYGGLTSPSHLHDRTHDHCTASPPLHHDLHASPSPSQQVEQSPNSSTQRLSVRSIGTTPRGRRRSSATSQPSGRILLVVKNDRYGRKLHPSDRAAREMTRAYRHSLHKDGYSWEHVPQHVRDIYWNQWKLSFDWEPSDDAAIREAYDRQIATRYADFISKMCSKDKKPANVSTEIFNHYKKMRSTPDFKKKSERASKNRRTETGGPGTGIAVHTGGSISIYQHAERLAEKLDRPPTALELCLYFHTKDHDGVTFLDSRVEKIVTAIQHRRIELTQSEPDTSIDETELYLSVVERDNKGRTYGIGWTPSRSWRRPATAGGVGGAKSRDGAGSSRPISSLNEPIELLQRDFQEMQTQILRVMQDRTLTQDQLREVQGQLRRMEQALMDRLGISFAPAPPSDVPAS
ncbi:hypothetical protein Syun_030433 [Stephania yunnanensis]|uniref:Transposase-associated domain-containing protein n=1 Tax=Stephania yunnanensis TaxID=152371 RepID=A0AAP0E7J0_9MAGN